LRAALSHYARNPLPGDPADPESLRALLERYLLWMATHHYAAAPSWSAASRLPLPPLVSQADRHSRRRGDA